MPKINLSDFINKKFGRLTVANVYRGDKSYVMAEANCSCGKKWIGLLHNLRSGCTQSCGCIGEERARNAKNKNKIVKASLDA